MTGAVAPDVILLAMILVAMLFGAFLHKMAHVCPGPAGAEWPFDGEEAIHGAGR